MKYTQGTHPITANWTRQQSKTWKVDLRKVKTEWKHTSDSISGNLDHWQCHYQFVRLWENMVENSKAVGV